MTSTPARRSLPLLALFVLLVGCRPSPPPSGLPVVQVRLGSKDFSLEVASNQESRERGLMRRDSMAADKGMIFVFVNAEPVAFYMKNTRIPLDIVFLDDQGVVISISQMKPYDLTNTPSGGPTKWAIELNQGAAAGAGIKVGDKVQIPESARTAEP